MSIELKLAYHMGYEDALARRSPDSSKTDTMDKGTCHITDNGPWGYPYVCSECDASFDADVNNGEFNFCPNCGRSVEQ